MYIIMQDLYHYILSIEFIKLSCNDDRLNKFNYLLCLIKVFTAIHVYIISFLKYWWL